jgi:hypothetical protein
LATDDHPDDNGGLPDRSVSFDEILQLTREEAAKVVGVHAWDVAHLQRVAMVLTCVREHARTAE